MTEETMMRRTPKQKRGQQRVTQILDAAARLIVRDGYEKVSTNSIAKEAKTSIGSLYQFFPNKEAVYLGLAERYIADLNALMANSISVEGSSPTVAEQFDNLIDRLILFYVENPGFQPLFFGAYNTPASSDEIMCQMVDGMEEMLLPLVAQKDRCRLQANVMMDTLKGTLPLITTDDDAHNQAALTEIKTMLQGYLQVIIDG